MSDPRTLLPLSPRQAAERLASLGEAARGFLGCDPVTDNVPLLARSLQQVDTVVLACGDTVLGARVNPYNPRQAVIAATAPDTEALTGLEQFLRTYRRCSSLTALVAGRDPVRPALDELGFTCTAVLRGHFFRGGRHLDGHVLHRALEPVCT